MLIVIIFAGLFWLLSVQNSIMNMNLCNHFIKGSISIKGKKNPGLNHSSIPDRDYRLS